MLRELAPVSEGYLRKLLRESAVPLAPLVEGIRQDSLDALERTLLAVLREYEAGDKSRKADCRRAVITAKNHARWAQQRTERDSGPFCAVQRKKEKPEKEETILWLLTWLENPSVFPLWLALRRKVLRGF